MKRRLKTLALSAATTLLAAALNAALAGYSDDVQAMLANMYPMLETGTPGQTRAWQNPADNSSWRVTLVSSFMRDGAKCGTVDLAGTGKLGSNERNFTLCKQADGRWAIAD